MQKKYLIFLVALFAAAPVLAKPAAIQKSQLIGTPKDETLTYRHIGNGTWTLNAEKVGLNIKTTNVERRHNPEKIRTAAWRETDNETFAQMRSTIGKPGRLQMQVKQIGNGMMRVRMQGDRNDMTCQKA